MERRKTYIIEDLEQLKVLADPFRIKLLERLVEEALTVKQLAERIDESPAKVHYHVKELERVGLIKLVKTREKGGILEKYYRAVAELFRLDRSFPPLKEGEGALRGAVLDSIREALDEARRAHPPVLVAIRRVRLTEAGLKELQREVEELLERFDWEEPQAPSHKVVFLAYPQGRDNS